MRVAKHPISRAPPARMDPVVTFVSPAGTDSLLLDAVAGPNLLNGWGGPYGGIKDSYCGVKSLG